MLKLLFIAGGEYGSLLSPWISQQFSIQLTMKSLWTADWNVETLCFDVAKYS